MFILMTIILGVLLASITIFGIGFGALVFLIPWLDVIFVILVIVMIFRWIVKRKS